MKPFGRVFFLFSIVFAACGAMDEKTEAKDPEKTETADMDDLREAKAAYSINDYDFAVRHFTLAAEQGNAEAQFILGFCYYNGEGVKQDNAEAAEWWHKAAEQGNAHAQHNLGVCYERGMGVEQDLAEAVEWYRKAAEQGFAKAQFNLGFCYEHGRGVEQDHAEAVKWIRKAAEQGSEPAKEYLEKLGN